MKRVVILAAALRRISEEMHSKIKEIAFCLLLIILIASSNLALQVESKENEWELCQTCAIPARMALNSSPGLALVPRRHIYLLIEPSSFSVEKLTKLFEGLSAEYPDPVSLAITAFSEKRFLKQLIIAEEAAVIVDFVDSAEGRKAQERYYAGLYPPKTGYLRAYYLRRGVEESFQYTPDAASEKTVLIILRRQATKS